MDKNVLGLVNCPIDKNFIEKNVKVTEILSKKCDKK